MRAPRHLRVSGAWTDSSSPILLNNVQVIDGPFDMIVGLPTIRKHDLTRALRHLFFDVSETLTMSVTNTLAGHVVALQLCKRCSIALHVSVTGCGLPLEPSAGDDSKMDSISTLLHHEECTFWKTSQHIARVSWNPKGETFVESPSTFYDKKH